MSDDSFAGSVAARDSREELMLRISWEKNGGIEFTVSGRMDAENVAQLKNLLSSEACGRHIILNLRELILVDQEMVRFLEACEATGIVLTNCPEYIREWIDAERRRRCNT